jgi:hypothetical protein
MNKLRYGLVLVLSCFYSVYTYADGVVVDKVYHPYVLPNEREVEWRLLSHQTNDNNQAQRFAYGQSVLDDVMIELYVIGERDNDGDFGIASYEIETRWMLTEQGEYWADWGVLFEIEREHNQGTWEATAGVLFEKEIGRTSLTINAFLLYEWGQSIQDEMEVEFRVQYRYRWLPQFQPAIELYSGEDYAGIGPAFMGIQRFHGQKQLKWEAGFITGLNSESEDHILRVAIEFEF